MFSAASFISSIENDLSRTMIPSGSASNSSFSDKSSGFVTLLTIKSPNYLIHSDHVIIVEMSS